MTVLLAAAFTAVAVLGVAVVLCHDPLRQVVVNGVLGLALVTLFVVLQAPDVAISEVVVSTVAYPLIILVAIYRAHGDGGGK